MTKTKLWQLVQLAVTPAILIFLGGLLMVKPDIAPVFVSRLLGWLILIAGIILAIGFIGSTKPVLVKLLPCLICFFLAGWVMKNPLAVMATVTKLAGILIVTNAAQDISRARKLGQSMTWAVCAVILGAVFVLMPLTASRLVLKLCGLTIAAVGGLMLWARLRRGKLLNSPDDHGNVIDAL